MENRFFVDMDARADAAVGLARELEEGEEQECGKLYGC
jgi:hypothetical protein